MITTIAMTILSMLVFQKAAVWLAGRHSENETLDGLYDRIYGFCDTMGWAVPKAEPEDVEGLDRYPEDGENPFNQFITKIVVPDEYSRKQVMLALRHLHDGMSTDTGYMAVNYLVHLYADETGEPTGDTPWIVVEPDIDLKTRIERAGMALEKSRTSGYGWTDAQFDIWWNRDRDFVERTTAWPDGFRGTRKGHVLYEAETVLKADAAR